MTEDSDRQVSSGSAIPGYYLPMSDQNKRKLAASGKATFRVYGRASGTRRVAGSRVQGGAGSQMFWMRDSLRLDLIERVSNATESETINTARFSK